MADNMEFANLSTFCYKMRQLTYFTQEDGIYAKMTRS